MALQVAFLPCENRNVKGIVGYDRYGQKYLIEPDLANKNWIFHEYVAYDKLGRFGAIIDNEGVDDYIKSLDMVRIEDPDGDLEKLAKAMK